MREFREEIVFMLFFQQSHFALLILAIFYSQLVLDFAVEMVLLKMKR
jgi:hypothetical protein